MRLWRHYISRNCYTTLGKARRYFKWLFSVSSHTLVPTTGSQSSESRFSGSSSFCECERSSSFESRALIDHLHANCHCLGVSHQRSVIMKSVPTVELSGGAFSDPMGWSPSICLWTGWEGTPAQQLSIPRWDLPGSGRSCFIVTADGGRWLGLGSSGRWDR